MHRMYISRDWAFSLEKKMNDERGQWISRYDSHSRESSPSLCVPNLLISQREANYRMLRDSIGWELSDEEEEGLPDEDARKHGYEREEEEAMDTDGCASDEKNHRDRAVPDETMIKKKKIPDSPRVSPPRRARPRDIRYAKSRGRMYRVDGIHEKNLEEPDSVEASRPPYAPSLSSAETQEVREYRASEEERNRLVRSDPAYMFAEMVAGQTGTRVTDFVILAEKPALREPSPAVNTRDHVARMQGIPRDDLYDAVRPDARKRKKVADLKERLRRNRQEKKPDYESHASSGDSDPGDPSRGRTSRGDGSGVQTKKENTTPPWSSRSYFSSGAHHGNRNEPMFEKIPMEGPDISVALYQKAPPADSEELH